MYYIVLRFLDTLLMWAQNSHFGIFVGVEAAKLIKLSIWAMRSASMGTKVDECLLKRR